MLLIETNTIYSTGKRVFQRTRYSSAGNGFLVTGAQIQFELYNKNAESNVETLSFIEYPL
jgi:hypothetical protein